MEFFQHFFQIVGYWEYPVHDKDPVEPDRPSELKLLHQFFKSCEHHPIDLSINANIDEPEAITVPRNRKGWH